MVVKRRRRVCCLSRPVPWCRCFALGGKIDQRPCVGRERASAGKIPRNNIDAVCVSPWSAHSAHGRPSQPTEIARVTMQADEQGGR